MILLLPFFSLSIRSKPNTPAKLKFLIHFYPPRPHFLFFCCLTLQICAHTYPLRRTTSSLSHSRDRVCLNNRIASVFSICESTIFGERQSEFCDFLSTLLTFLLNKSFDKAKVLERMTYGKAMSILHRAKKIRFDETGTQSDTEYHRHVP